MKHANSGCLLEPHETPVSRLLDTEVWAPERGCDVGEDEGGIKTRAWAKSSRWSVQTRRGQGKNPGDAPWKMPAKGRQKKEDPGKKDSRGEHGQRYQLLYGRCGWKSLQDLAMWRSLVPCSRAVFKWYEKKIKTSVHSHPYKLLQQNFMRTNSK